MARRRGISIDISMIGDKELVRAFKALPEKVDRKLMSRAMRAGMRPVLAASKAAAPVDTGALRKGIRMRVGRRGRRGRRVHQIVVRTGTRAEMGIPADSRWYYPAHVELGTKRMAGRAFLRGPFSAQKPQILERTRRALWAGIRSYWSSAR